MNLLLVEADEVDGRGRVRLDGRRAEHLLAVLKVEVGRRLRAGIVGGRRVEAEVTAVDGHTVELRLAPAEPDAAAEAQPAGPSVDLVLALPRPPALRRILQTAATMGVRRLDLVNAWRVEKSYFQTPVLEPAELRRQLVLGAEQGMTTRLPEVAVHKRLLPFVDELGDRDAGVKLLAHPGAGRTIEDAWPPAAAGGPVVVAIGPEGGWIDREVDTLAGAGCVAVELGPWVLRVETAVPAALAQLELMHRRIRSQQRINSERS